VSRLPQAGPPVPLRERHLLRARLPVPLWQRHLPQARLPVALRERHLLRAGLAVAPVGRRLRRAGPPVLPGGGTGPTACSPCGPTVSRPGDPASARRGAAGRAPGWRRRAWHWPPRARRPWRARAGQRCPAACRSRRLPLPDASSHSSCWLSPVRHSSLHATESPRRRRCRRPGQPPPGSA
jgi:hypothetical protein